jgi:hypothetical protein
MTDLLHYISYIRDGKTTAFCSLVEAAEVDDETEFITPWLGDGETRCGPGGVHGFCQPSAFDCGELIADKLAVRGRQTDWRTVRWFAKRFNLERFNILLSDNIF